MTQSFGTAILNLQAAKIERLSSWSATVSSLHDLGLTSDKMRVDLIRDTPTHGSPMFAHTSCIKLKTCAVVFHKLLVVASRTFLKDCLKDCPAQNTLRVHTVGLAHPGPSELPRNS